MSDPSKTPSGNRPPRVFRPFTGPQSGQEAPVPPAKVPMGRRTPTSLRPFFGRPARAAEPQIEVPAPALVATTSTDEQATTVTPSPELPQATLPTNAEQEAWKSYLGLPSSAEPRPVTMPELAAIEPASDSKATAPEPLEIEAVDAAAQQPITVEVPAYEDLPRPRVVTRELPAVLEDVALDAEEAARPAMEPEPDVLEAPRFVAPASEPPAESLIDEIDAAFISSGLPTSNNRASEAAKRAAATLESVAQRLRSGKIELRDSGTDASSEESVLATVLAALLANR